MRRRAALALAACVAASCRFDRSDRWDDLPVATDAGSGCAPGAVRCSGALERCAADGSAFTVADDCPARGLVCAPTLGACATCLPGTTTCDGQTVVACADDGASRLPVARCEPAQGIACRAGGCTDLCAAAAKSKSNVGCEYWAVDLDNARISDTSNAAAQQFAVVVSNPEPDLSADILVEQDDGVPGGPPVVVQVAAATVAPLGLTVLKLGPREIDGSAEGTFDTGTGTALTRHAYRLRSKVPVVAYQFNPLENVNVFSNDASLLKPVEALTYTPGAASLAYVAVGWPQTIASSDDPDTNFNPANPIDLRAFLTLVGTREATHVRVTTAARVIPGGPVADTPAGGVIDVTLGAFDVLNLETGGFRADFTGSTIVADQPLVVFSGSEASDAPWFTKLSDRFCCADHLEEQLDPVRTAGTSFVLAHTPSRTRAVVAAGAAVTVVDEPEYFRVVAVRDGTTHVTTTLPAPDDAFDLTALGAYRELRTLRDATLQASAAVIVGDVQASQEAAGIRRGLPGGDPSLVIVPPTQQYRSSYVFLTPDKYAFDFVLVVAPPDAHVLLDLAPLDATRCEVAPADGLTAAERGSATPPFVVYRCQLSFPVIDPAKTAPDNLTPGAQNDGVHRLASDRDVGVLVFGFDSFVSYGYAGGTKLEEINVH